MALVKKIAQIRYYGDGDTKNYPSDVAYRKLVSGSIFSDKLPIVQLGIQTLPGQKFYLNNSTSPIIVGTTGIYELELDGVTEITAIRFDAETLNVISQHDTAYLIVDMIYRQEG